MAPPSPCRAPASPRSCASIPGDAVSGCGSGRRRRGPAEGPAPEARDDNEEDDDETKRDPDAELREAALADERFRTLQGYRFKVSHSLVLRDGSRLRLDGKAVEDARLAGQSPVLGKCLVSLDQVRQIRLTPALPLEETEPMDLAAFHDWRACSCPTLSFQRTEKPRPLRWLERGASH